MMLQAGKQAFLASSFLTRAAQQRFAGPTACLARYATVDSTADTHDDFKTVYKSGQGKPAQDAMSQIKQDVEGHDVFIYMKGEPDAPMCGFSNMACRVLNHYGVNFGSRNILADQEVRDAVKKYTSWPTIPQVFVKSEFIGGSDILLSMHESGDLEALLKPIRDQQRAG
ncbi:glutaredoxin [Dunaliella salina]|uniref:Glutaredoxin n=1 Tax=Dunaliella salina TaxID=3046 RepID=A0ABQ7H3Q7_DUNSA|nr:glutaredoxin [Dunaliella salina]|eukprot:KAF5841489.1 glutaredoxin [Dunaliella salina]